MKKVFVLLGPTASGKTALSLSLANELNAEIISADSRQVYKHIQLATCAPTAEELSKAKHYFVNELELNEDFNAGTFAKLSKEIISDIHNRGKNVLIVGGSGLYIKSLIDGFFEEEIKNLNIREKLNERLRTEGREVLYSELMSVDPDTASKMDAGKFRRVIRALEVFYATGKKMSEQQENTIKPDFDSIQIGLTFERELLYERINQRVDGLIVNGLLDEINALVLKGFNPETHNSLNTVGVKEVFRYLRKEITIEEMAEQIKQNTRRYAKRQMTWFNADKRINWIKVSDYENTEISSSQILKVLNES
ncbi:MAG: tRNA (adenosine(37)-N6)-dimethylallyltransferase MiaA [Ignavibacteria bacterium]